MASATSTARLAVDVGGTFTDVVLAARDEQFATKVLTTPDAPERAILEGTRVVLAEAQLGLADIGIVIHGTTLATNAIIERKGAKTALIATEGFRDVIEIADESRYDQYDLLIDKPKVLVPRRLRFTVPERVDVEGNVRLRLDEKAVALVASQLAQTGVEAVAVAFLHSYINPVHEQRVGALLRDMCPGLAVTLSSEVCPEMREYERTSTAIANAYVQPMMAGYLERLEAAFAKEGYRRPIHLMTSGGNLTSLATARQFPVRLVESGPAGGAILSAHVAAERGEDKVLSFDMGGTTAKICLIRDYTPFKARTFEIDRAARFLKGSGLPVRIPVIEMVEIGAGGGSIAKLDALKRITVGPESAASVPGPACYDRGGTAPTVTDADVVLGRIDVEGFAGGMLKLAPARSGTALDAAIGTPLQLSTETAAYGVAEIVDENMANAARVHAVERGVVIGEHTLIAFGGAAPLHAARLAEKLGLQRVIIPRDAGVGSAVGFLRAPAAYELVRSRFMRLDAFEPEIANTLLGDMGREARALAESAAGGRRLEEQRLAYMRYTGQGHEIAVALPLRDVTAKDADSIRKQFEADYRKLFERHIPGARIEILSWSVLVTTASEPPAKLRAARSASPPRPSGAREVWDTDEGRAVSVATYERSAIKPGSRLQGPALILEAGTSTFVTAAFEASIDGGGALVLERKKAKKSK
ncbi:MAG TPA: hydantoinase/oxoprolinase family protein [Hyphomicrobiaceae bacterium]|nr:hydantoinase/oxoprolinase family protein [Hyphomicrobiaceae bacterium]